MLSVEAGQEIGLCVSTTADSYSVKIARVGAKTETVWQEDDICGNEFPVPATAFATGCDWPVTLRVRTRSSWRSGYYSVILMTDDGVARGAASFVVRSAQPGRTARILLQRTTNTDSAYNRWGGSSLYNGPVEPAHRVSFDRPFSGHSKYGDELFVVPGEFAADLDDRRVPDVLREAMAAKGATLSAFHFVESVRMGYYWYVIDAGALYGLRQTPSGVQVYDSFTKWASCWERWEHPFVCWAEVAGYSIDYAVNGDLEFRPEVLEGYRLVLSVGHDEYWSRPMRDHLERYIERGGNVAFFSGNALFWQVRSEAGGRQLVCWKESMRDPRYQEGEHDVLSTLWCHRLIGRPENHLTGVSFAYGGYHRFFDQHWDAASGYIVHRPDHWVFEGSGLEKGSLLGENDRVIGYECDGCHLKWRDGVPVAVGDDGTPSSFDVLATASASLSDADGSFAMVNDALFGQDCEKSLPREGAAVLGTYTRGGQVFTTGCTEWSNGLHGRDLQVERITRNVLDRLSS